MCGLQAAASLWKVRQNLLFSIWSGQTWRDRNNTWEFLLLLHWSGGRLQHALIWLLVSFSLCLPGSGVISLLKDLFKWCAKTPAALQGCFLRAMTQYMTLVTGANFKVSGFSVAWANILLELKQNKTKQKLQAFLSPKSPIPYSHVDMHGLAFAGEFWRTSLFVVFHTLHVFLFYTFYASWTVSQCLSFQSLPVGPFSVGHAF